MGMFSRSTGVYPSRVAQPSCAQALPGTLDQECVHLNSTEKARAEREEEEGTL